MTHGGQADPLSRRARLGRRALLGSFVALLAIVLSAAAVQLAILAPAKPTPPCSRARPCSTPQAPAAATPQLSRASHFWESVLGPGLRYDPVVWRVAHADGEELALVGHEGHLAVVVRAARSADKSPAEMLAAQLKREGQPKLALAPDFRPEHELLGPRLGFVDAIGRVYSAVIDLFPSPSARVQMVFLAATDGRSSVLVQVTTDADPEIGHDSATPFPIFADVDRVLSTLHWGPQ